MSETDLYRLEGKVALVTGGTSGIGEMAAVALTNAGASVYLTSRKATACAEVARRIAGQSGAAVDWISADLSREEECLPLAAELGEREPRLHVLVNNVGAVWAKPLQSFPDAVVHGHFRLDNCIMNPVHPGQVAAVLDWEMSTLGDPLTDLGMLLFYWREPGDPEISLVPAVTAQPGFPGRRHLAERYADATGTSLVEFNYYLAFAHFKFAVIVQGIAARVATRAMAGRDFCDLEPIIVGCMRRGLDIFS